MERGRNQPVAGNSDGFTQAIELVASTFIFACAGFWLDHHLGTTPVFTVVLGVLALFANVVKLYCNYQADMKAEAQGKPWARTR